MPARPDASEGGAGGLSVDSGGVCVGKTIYPGRPPRPPQIRCNLTIRTPPESVWRDFCRSGKLLRLKEITGITARVLGWRDWPGLARSWEALEAAGGVGSFFLSRAWEDSWVATFGESLKP